MAVTSVTLGRSLTVLGATMSVAGTLHSLWNMHVLRTPADDPSTVEEQVAVLLPVRNEAHRVVPCLRSLLDQRDVPHLDIWVLDDESIDGTADVVRQVAAHDPRVHVLTGRPLPEGWWGKTWACHQLADATCGDRASGETHEPTVLVFIDADVVLAPHAVAASVALLRTANLDLVSPYPRQTASSATERLVQPLLQWSWLTTLPLAVAERSPRPSLTAANGQFLAVDTAAYRAAGGHDAVRAEMLDDLGLARAVKRRGGRATVADGTRLATCHMYDGWAELRDGYAKSLWSAFGSPAGGLMVAGVSVVAWVWPPVAALRGSRLGLVGYAAAVAGRVAVGRRVGARVWPDAFAHPVSVAVFGWLTVLSGWRHGRGSLSVSGRPVP